MRSISARGAVMLAVFFSLIVFLACVLFKMEFFDYDAYQKKVIDQITVGSSLNADRGKIYDTNGNLLASNKTVWRVFISPVDIKTAFKKTKVDNSELIARELSDILGVSYENLLAKAKKTSTLDQTVKKGVDEETKNKVLDFIGKNALESMVHIEASTTRYYPYGNFACHLLGFTGSDNQGLFGVESSYNKELTGINGEYIYAKDAKGNQLPLEYISYKEAVNGNNITTTIDMYIQRVLEENVRRAMLETGASNRVTGIIMDVNDGGILAMATSPSYDLNNPYTLDSQSEEILKAAGYSEGSAEYTKLKSELLYSMWNNKAISEIYEPGSTFKVITAAIAMDSHSVSPNDRFDCIGYYKIGGYRIACHKKTGHGHGITFAYGLQQSCNPVMMQTAAKIGAEAFYKYYTSFGYLEKSGIDLPSESKGIFHKYEGLGTTELATASFGQRFKISPIEHITAISTVANGGHKITPHVVKSVTDAKGNTVYNHTNDNATQIISPETSKIVSEILEEGVSGTGGARNAGVVGYKIAAKTGTSQKFDDATGADTKKRIGSCIAYAPSDDAKVAVIFIVDEPNCFSKYGSVVAAPYISRILSDVLPYLGYEPSGESDGSGETEIKNFIGSEISDAVAEAKALGLECYVNGKKHTAEMKIFGTVTAQNPPEGINASSKNPVIYLYTDDYNIYTTVTVPNLIGLSCAEANSKLINAGLNIKITGVGGNIFDTEAICAMQSVPAGETIPVGSIIEITLLYNNSDD